MSTKFRTLEFLSLPFRKRTLELRKFFKLISTRPPQQFGVQKARAEPKARPKRAKPGNKKPPQSIQNVETEWRANEVSTTLRVRKHISSKGNSIKIVRPEEAVLQKAVRGLRRPVVRKPHPPDDLLRQKSLRELRRRVTEKPAQSIRKIPFGLRAHETSTTSKTTKHANHEGISMKVQQEYLAVHQEPLRALKAPVKHNIRRIPHLVVQKVPTEPQPLVPIRRPQNLVIQKVPTEPKVVESSVKAQLPFYMKMKPHLSASRYTIPTRQSTTFWNKAGVPPVDQVEDIPPPNLDDETPPERVERIVESAHAKRIHREAWNARTGVVRLSISLLFSAESWKTVRTLYKKYNPEGGEVRFFTVVERLDMEKYTQYEEMLNRLTATWQPFSMRAHTPGRRLNKARFMVGLKLASKGLELLEKELVVALKKLHSPSELHRKMRSHEQLSMMVINGIPTSEFEDAIGLVERLKQEYKNGVADFRIEGLVLHAKLGRGDCQFPPPKEFLFSEREVTDQNCNTLVRVDATP